MNVFRLTRALAASVAMLGLLLAGPAAAFAQGEVVPATECVTPPRATTFLGEIVATPLPDATPAPITTIPAGTEVDPAVAAEITAAMRQVIACSNSGELLRAFALFSDAYLRRIVDPTGELEPDVANDLAGSFATPVPVNDDALVSLIGIHQLVQMSDGRVAAVVETDGGDPNPDGTDVDLFIFAKFDGVWLVDDAVNDIDDVTS